jgi:hypothetical protein
VTDSAASGDVHKLGVLCFPFNLNRRIGTAGEECVPCAAMLNAGEVVVLDAEIGLAEVPDEDMPGESPLEAALTSCIPSGVEANEYVTHMLGGSVNGNNVAGLPWL